MIRESWAVIDWCVECGQEDGVRNFLCDPCAISMGYRDEPNEEE
jgi:hypothetical protein